MANNILRLKQLPDIVESGSNANGNYIKYRDGTMICWGKSSITAAPSVGPVDGFYYNQATITFPQLFSSTDIAITGSCRIMGHLLTPCFNIESITTANSVMYFMSPASQESGAIYYSWQAVGKWSSVSTTTGPVVSIGRGIIESGANANGSYVKYEDGTMMQWGIIANGSVSFGAINGGNSYTQSITLPQPFTDVNSYSVQASGDVEANYVEVVRAFRATASTFTVEVNMATLGAGSQTLNGVSWFAIGKWQSASPMVGSYTYGQGIVETGTNSNGTYIKFDNGTLIMYGQITSPTTGSNTARTFPYAAVGISGYQSADCGMSCSATAVSGSVNSGNVWASTNTSFYYYITTNNYINWHFVGRWK